jgi:hypothetical protein
MNYMLFDGFRGMTVWLSMEAPSKHNLSGLSQTIHVHLLGCLILISPTPIGLCSVVSKNPRF